MVIGVHIGGIDDLPNLGVEQLMFTPTAVPMYFTATRVLAGYTVLLMDDRGLGVAGGFNVHVSHPLFPSAQVAMEWYNSQPLAEIVPASFQGSVSGFVKEAWSLPDEFKPGKYQSPSQMGLKMYTE